MKKKLLFVVPALMGLFLGACSSGGEGQEGGSQQQTIKYTDLKRRNITITISKCWKCLYTKNGY